MSIPVFDAAYFNGKQQPIEITQDETFVVNLTGFQTEVDLFCPVNLVLFPQLAQVPRNKSIGRIDISESAKAKHLGDFERGLREVAP